jgi:hypothetical protein
MENDMTDKMPSYGLLVINHAYNEGKITFSEWLQLSKTWAKAMQQGKPKACYSKGASESSHAMQAKKPRA